jgi:hypothetical protein
MRFVPQHILRTVYCGGVVWLAALSVVSFFAPASIRISIILLAANYALPVAVVEPPKQGEEL